MSDDDNLAGAAGEAPDLSALERFHLDPVDDGLGGAESGTDAAAAAGPEDPGQLSHDIRRVLVKLIRGPYLSIDPDQAQEIAEDAAFAPDDPENGVDGGGVGAGVNGAGGPGEGKADAGQAFVDSSTSAHAAGEAGAFADPAFNTTGAHDEAALFAAPPTTATPQRRRRRNSRTSTRTARRATSATAAQAMWRTLVDNKEIIRSRLADMYLDLVLDESRGLAFVRNMEGALDGRTVPKLMNPNTLNHVQTMLLVRLRQLHLQASTQKQVAYVERHEMYEYLRDFINLRGVENDVRAYDRANAAINKLQQLNVLAETSRTDRFRVQDIIVLLVTPRVADELIAQYQRIIAGEVLDADADDDVTGTEAGPDTDAGGDADTDTDPGTRAGAGRGAGANTDTDIPDNQENVDA